jgi:hypothetical protein
MDWVKMRSQGSRIHNLLDQGERCAYPDYTNCLELATKTCIWAQRFSQPAADRELGIRREARRTLETPLGGPKLSTVRRVNSVSPTTLACATGEPAECQKEDSSPPFWNPAPIHESGGDEAVPAPDITLWRIGIAWNLRRRKMPSQTWPSGSNALVRLVQVNVRHHDRLSPATCARLLPTAPTTPSRYRSARARHSSRSETAGRGTVTGRAESSEPSFYDSL